MTKTPDEIKKGLECCRNVLLGDHWKNCDSACPYQSEQCYCKNALHHDTLALIQQLQAENAQQSRCIENMTDKLNAMNSEVAKLQAERDAAVEDLESYATVKCFACKYYEKELTEEPCNECKIMGEGNRDMFEWRGVQKE